MFRYGYDVQSAMEPWREKLGDDYENVLARLSDRDRQLEDFLSELGQWEEWTPTWTNFTPGSATIVAKYTKIGRTVHFRLVVTLSGSTMGSGPLFTLPARSALAVEAVIGTGQAKDAGVANWPLAVWHFSTTQAQIVYWNGSSNAAALTSTAPFTWTNTDVFSVEGTYEAAA